MTATDTSAPHAAHQHFVEEQLRTLHQIVRADPDKLNSDKLMQEGFDVLAMGTGDERQTRIELIRSHINCMKQRDEMVQAVSKLQDQKPEQGWVLSGMFNVAGRSFVYVMPISKDASPPGLYEVVEALRPGRQSRRGREGQRERRREPVNGHARNPPFLGFVLGSDQVYLGPVDGQMPAPPLRGEIFEAVTAYPQPEPGDLSEIEVTDGTGERAFTVFAQSRLAQDVKQRMEDDGQAVRVRVESGVATTIHETNEQKEEDWLEFPPAEGPRLGDLVLTSSLREEYARDIRRLVKGRAVQVCLMGPTGCGKTTCAERVGRDALAKARLEGKDYRDFCILRPSSSRIGSSYIHKTERNLLTVMRRARRLAAKGYIVVVLIDEADALLGEMEGGEHTHNRSERLTAQELLSEPTAGVAIYLTLNPRRNSWLPAAIERRFQRREHGRAGRGQMAAVAEMYIARRPAVLGKLKMTASEFGAVFADNLFSDRREVAVMHMHSGRRVPVHAHDLHSCCPGKAKELIDIFSDEVEDEITESIDFLWTMIDREFFPANLSRSNLFELTFLKPIHNDEVRTVELKQ